MRMGEKPGDDRRIRPAGCRQGAAVIVDQPAPRQHQIIDRRIGRPGVEGQASARHLWRRLARIDPGHIAHAAQVQKHQRRIGPQPLGQREVIKRHKRRALPPQRNVGAAEIPDHRQAQHLGQQRAIAGLMRAAPARLMRQGLAVKAHHLGTVEPAEDLGMGVLDHLGGLGHTRLAGPAAKGCTDDAGLCRRVGPKGRRPELQHPFAIGQHHRRIDAIQRGARHRAQGPDRTLHTRLQHPLPPAAFARYTPPVL